MVEYPLEKLVGRVILVAVAERAVAVVSGGRRAVATLEDKAGDLPKIGDLIELHLAAASDDATPRSARGWRLVRRPQGPNPVTSTRSEWYRFHANDAELLRNIEHRAQLYRQIRAYFDERSFIEVHTPGLARSPGLELHLEACEVALRPAPGADIEAQWLVTSPEYYMKRLLAAGMQRIYQLMPAWRSGETGQLHNPEFTMLEFYRAGETWNEIALDIETLVAESALSIRGEEAVRLGPGHRVSVERPWPRKTFAALIEEFGGYDPWPWSDPEALWHRANSAGIGVDDRDRTDSAAIFARTLVERVEPALDRHRPLVVYDYPDCMASLARPNPASPGTVERFEIYMGDVELANGFGELTDPAEQRQRLESDVREREKSGRPVYPIDERFLRALEDGLPDCAGVAMGVDRLLMLLCGTADIRRVLAFPMGKA